MPHSDYTIQLKTLMDSTLFEVFDFDMPFYCADEELKHQWQVKFLRKYAFYDIGHETVARWKWMLEQKLEEVMPYYQQLYITEMKSKDIEFLLNKDYTETYERSVTKATEENSKVDGTSENTSNSTSTAKVSDIANGCSDVGLSQGKLTGMSEDKSNGSSNAKSGQTANTTGNGNEDESYTLVGKGNIGTTSSAELLQAWRDVLINIDKQLLDECRELFLQVF